MTEKQIWILDGTKEVELDNQNLDSHPRRVTSANYQLCEKSDDQPFVAKSSEINPSEINLFIGDKSIKIKPSELHFPTGDKTTRRT